MVATIDDERKICTGCLRNLPLAGFGPRKHGRHGRQSRCRRCAAAYMRGFRRAQRTRSLHQFSAQVRQATSLNRVVGLVNGMVERLGGLDGLARAWCQAVQAAGRDKPGGRVVLNSLFAILKLVQAAEASRQKNDVSNLTDEELLHVLLGGTVE